MKKSSKIQVRYQIFPKNWDLKYINQQDYVILANLLRCEFIMHPFEKEVLRITFFHSEYDKIDLSNLKDIIHLKFRFFNNGKEFDNENDLIISKYSFCYRLIGGDPIPKLIDSGEYNQSKEIMLLTKISLNDYQSYNWGRIHLNAVLKEPMICIIVECGKYIAHKYYKSNVDECIVDLDDRDNFQIIRTTNPLELYVGSKFLNIPEKFIENKNLKFLAKRLNRD